MATARASVPYLSPSVTVANLSIYQGDDYGAVVEVQASDGTPADLTGYTAAAQIRCGPADEAEVLLDLTLTLDSPVAGSIAIAIPHTDTETLPGGRYVWDLQLTSPAGMVATLLTGSVIVQPEVTR